MNDVADFLSTRVLPAPVVVRRIQIRQTRKVTGTTQEFTAPGLRRIW